MSAQDTGGPAYPAPDAAECDFGKEHRGAYFGMTLRDRFALEAMGGWLASFPDGAHHPVNSGTQDAVARMSYLMADAMLKARKA